MEASLDPKPSYRLKNSSRKTKRRKKTKPHHNPQNNQDFAIIYETGNPRGWKNRDDQGSKCGAAKAKKVELGDL